MATHTRIQEKKEKPEEEEKKVQAHTLKPKVYVNNFRSGFEKNGFPKRTSF